MKFNRYKTSPKRKMSKKYILPIALIAVVVALCSYTTFAWIVSTTEPYENKFQLQKADVSIDEEFDNEVKENVKVTNTGEATMYVRVALVEQIEITTTDENSNSKTVIVPNTTGELYFDYEGLPGTKWIQIGDYYYYKEPVTAGASTDVLFDSATQKNSVVLGEGEELSLTVMTDAVQVNALTGNEKVWNVILENGVITRGGTD